MPYIEKVIKAGSTVYVWRGYSSRYNIRGGTRSKHRDKTKEAQERANNRKRCLDMTMLLNANFVPGDYHVVLKYDTFHKPTTLDQAKDDRVEFMRQLRKECKKNGITHKYVLCTEAGKRGALHHHLVINNMDTRILNQCWGNGWVTIYPLDNSGEYSKLANYLVKYQNQWKERKGPGRAWSVSRGMERPEPVIRIVKDRNAFYTDPRARKGYYINKDSVRCGLHEITGYTFLEYIMVKNQERRAP